MWTLLNILWISSSCHSLFIEPKKKLRWNPKNQEFLTEERGNYNMLRGANMNLYLHLKRLFRMLSNCFFTTSRAESYSAYRCCTVNIRLRLHGAIYRPDSFVLMQRYCENLKAIRCESTSLNRIVADKSHRAIVALENFGFHNEYDGEHEKVFIIFWTLQANFCDSAHVE